MLGEDDEFFSLAFRTEHILFILQQTGQLVPFAVLAAGANCIGHLLQTFQSVDFRLHFGDGIGCGRSIGHIFLGIFQFCCGVIIFVKVVIGGKRNFFAIFLASTAHFFLRQYMFQPLPSAAKRLIDCFRR